MNQLFESAIDDLVLLSDSDPELASNIAWLDKTNVYGLNLNFYEKVNLLLTKHSAKQKAKEWLDEK